MPIKICHVTSMHPAFDTRIFHKECVSLSKKYEVYLIASNVDTQFKNGVHIIGVPMPTNGIKRRLITKPIIRAAESVDAEIYHFHDPVLMVASSYFKKLGKKIIFDYHENYAEYLLAKEWIPRFLRKPISFFFLKYEKYYLHRFDSVITVTPHILKRLLTYNKNSFQITNYPIYVDIADNRKWGKSVCFVGGIIPEWMHHNIVKSLQYVDARYHLAGVAGSSLYFDKLKHTEGWDKVDYAGKISYETIFNYMQECSAGLTISTYHDPNAGYKQGTLGVNKLFEYMMAGIPIISTDLILWKDIIEKYKCGICVNPEDPRSIASAIDILVNNKEKAMEMGNNAHKAAMQEFNWASQEKTLFSIYEKLLNKEK